jgi:hypothetical protein
MRFEVLTMIIIILSKSWVFGAMWICRSKRSSFLQSYRPTGPKNARHIQHPLWVREGVQTGRLIETRDKDHHRHICLEHPKKPAIAEHSTNLGHQIQLHNTNILANKPRYMDWIIREVIQLELHPNTINKGDGFSLGTSWKPLIRDLSEHKPAPNKNMTPSVSPEKVIFFPSSTPYRAPSQ